MNFNGVGEYWPRCDATLKCLQIGVRTESFFQNQLMGETSVLQ